MGAMNFIMQMNPDTLVTYPEAARALVEGRPVWATAAFAIAVFGGALGCVLLLLKKSAASYLFIASLLGVMGTMIHTFGLATTSISNSIMTGTLMSLAVAALLVWYAKYAVKRGWID